MLFDTMLSMCRRYTQDEDQQITIINDGLLKIFKKINQFKDDGSFEGWARRLMFTTLSDYFRKENRYLKFILFEPKETHLDPSMESDLYYNDIIELVKLLPFKTQKVFTMYAVEGYTHQDIGDQLSISVGTSKWHLSEARKKLRLLLKERNIHNSHVR